MPTYKVSLPEAVQAFRAMANRYPKLPKLIATRLFRAVQNETITHSLAGDPIKARTGSLRRYAAAQLAIIQQDGMQFSMGIPKGEEYPTTVEGRTFNTSTAVARFLEQGGTVTPKGHPFLRVPMAPALTGQGVDRLAGLTLRDPAVRAMINPPLFFRVAKSGVPTLARRGKDGSLETWYVLKPSVTVPAFYWFRRAVEAKKPNLPGIARDEIAKAVESAS